MGWHSLAALVAVVVWQGGLKGFAGADNAAPICCFPAPSCCLDAPVHHPLGNRPQPVPQYLALHLQVRKTFEDLYAEALRMNAGRSSLAPYHLVARKEIAAAAAAAAEGAADAATQPAHAPRSSPLPAIKAHEAELDPTSVLAAAYDGGSSCSSGSASPASHGSSSRRRATSAFAAHSTGIRSHPISSLLDLDGAAGTSLAAEVANNAIAAAAEAAVQEPGAALGSWRRHAYDLLQLLWSASNAALGMAPDAVEQLEEMAVLI